MDCWGGGRDMGTKEGIIDGWEIRFLVIDAGRSSP